MDNWKEGDTLLCINEYGWTPGCITIGKTYKIRHIQKNNYDDKYTLIIEGNGAKNYRTAGYNFKLLSEVRNEKIDDILWKNN